MRCWVSYQIQHDIFCMHVTYDVCTLQATVAECSSVQAEEGEVSARADSRGLHYFTILESLHSADCLLHVALFACIHDVVVIAVLQLMGLP